MSRVPRIQSPPGTFAELLELTFRDARDVDLTDERARYGRVVERDAQRLLVLGEKQWECCRPGEQWVSVIEEQRIIVIGSWVDFDHAGYAFPVGTWAVEIWATEEGYEDRLDDLAGVTVEVGAA